jgi:hypothetical protein
MSSLFPNDAEDFYYLNLLVCLIALVKGVW